MVIGIFGESCTGKSTLAQALSQALGCKVYSGKDYARMAKGEVEARESFIKLLKSFEQSEETVLYVISEKEHICFLPEKALRVLVTAGLETIQNRFAKRMNGNLPTAAGVMLEKKHGMFEGEQHDVHVESDKESTRTACERILRMVGKGREDEVG